MAISGLAYCPSAYNGFLNNLKHAYKFYFAIKLAKELIGIGQIFVICISVGFFVISEIYLIAIFDSQGIDYDNIMIPAAFAAFFALFVSSLFLGVFDYVVLATVQCYSVDCDLNNGVPEWGSATYQNALAEIYGNDKNA